MNLCFQNTWQRAFGTFPLKGDELKTSIGHAVDVGYRAFDTAQMYENEADTGAALAAAGVDRNQLCITTKVHPDNFSEGRFLASVEQSLKALQVETVDLLILHWPPADGDIAPSLKLLEQALKQGLTGAIGISNYTAAMMKKARDVVDAPITTNQVEFHPLLNQDKLLVAANETNIPLSSYSSVARGEVFKYPIFSEIGQGYGKSAAQIVLRWILQKGVSLNTMSTKLDNIRDNFNIMDFTLSSIDMARIDAMTHTGYRIVTSDLVPFAPAWD